MAPRIPVTVLAGSAGSGKTTLLNRILAEHHGRRVAVIANELAEIGVDPALMIETDEELCEPTSGCTGCTVRADLIRVLGDLAARPGALDLAVVETTGTANPGPVAQTFFADEEVQARFRLDAIVTVVDARQLELHLGERPEAVEQIAFADVLVINKADLAGETELGAVERRIRGINAVAPVLRGSHGGVPLDQVLDVGGFELGRALAIHPAFLDPERSLERSAAHELGAGPAHDASVSSVGLWFDRPFDGQRLDAWLVRLLRERGGDIFRMKGVLAVAGSDRRYVFQGVHMLFDGRLDRPWGDAAPTSQIVLIGKRLDRAALRDGLAACLA